MLNPRGPSGVPTMQGDTKHSTDSRDCKVAQETKEMHQSTPVIGLRSLRGQLLSEARGADHASLPMRPGWSAPTGLARGDPTCMTGKPDSGAAKITGDALLEVRFSSLLLVSLYRHCCLCVATSTTQSFYGDATVRRWPHTFWWMPPAAGSSMQSRHPCRPHGRWMSRP